MALYDITKLGSPLEFDTADYGNSGSGGKLSTTRFVLAWQSTTNVKKVQCFSLNRSTGAIAAEDSALTFSNEVADAQGISLTVIDSTHFIIFWIGTAGDGFCQVFSVNSGTGAITAMGSPTEYDTVDGLTPSSVLMDATHVLNCWGGSGSDGFAQIFTVNTGTGGITAEGSAFEYDTTEGLYPSVAKISATKALVCYAGASQDGNSRVLDINTSTWAVTGAAASSVFQASILNVSNNVIILAAGSPTTAIDLYLNTTGGTTGYLLRQLSINTSTWAVTNLGTQLQVSTENAANFERSLQRIDDTHFIVWLSGNSGILYARTYSINLGTGAFTLLNEVQVLAGSPGKRDVSVDMEGGLFVDAWNDTDGGGDGFVQAFSVALPSTTSIKTFDGLADASVKTVNGLARASVKTFNGLA